MNKKAIFGFTGLPSSGKGTATEYLAKKYGASTFRYSTILRNLINRLYLPEDRNHLIKMSECVRAKFGEDVLAKAIAKDAENAKTDIVVAEGIRRLADIEHLDKLSNFVLVVIEADIQIRYDRLIHRGENQDDNTKTFEQFVADHQRSTELSVLDVTPHAKEKIDNNGNIGELYKQLDNLVKKYT